MLEVEDRIGALEAVLKLIACSGDDTDNDTYREAAVHASNIFMTLKPIIIQAELEHLSKGKK